MLVFFSAFSVMAFAQTGNVGINTPLPQHPLHIDGAADNPSDTVPSATAAANDVSFTAGGKLGIGTLNPVAKVDVRGTGNTDNAVAFGQTAQTAAEAGAGAVRYSPFGGSTIQFSDGATWYRLSSNSVKASVTGKIRNSVQIPNDTPVTITTWSEFADSTDSFDNGIFTAPRTGVYLASATFNIDNILNTQANPFYADATAEVRFIVNGNTDVPYTKCIKTFGEVSATQMQVGGYCIVGIKLNKDDTVSVQIYQRINGTTVKLRNDSSGSTFGFNNLTINEQ